jgi:hypothetical protein
VGGKRSGPREFDGGRQIKTFATLGVGLRRVLELGSGSVRRGVRRGVRRHPHGEERGADAGLPHARQIDVPAHAPDGELVVPLGGERVVMAVQDRDRHVDVTLTRAHPPESRMQTCTGLT